MDQNILEGESLSIDLNAIDVDGDSEFTYSVSNSNTSLIDVSISSNVLTIQPIENQYGVSELTIIANDGLLDSEPLSFNLVVTNVNDAPTLSDINNQQVDEDSDNILLTLNPADVDLEDNLTVSVTSSNSLLLSDEDISIDPASAVNGVERNIIFPFGFLFA